MTKNPNSNVEAYETSGRWVNIIAGRGDGAGRDGLCVVVREPIIETDFDDLDSLLR